MRRSIKQLIWFDYGSYIFYGLLKKKYKSLFFIEKKPYFIVFDLMVVTLKIIILFYKPKKQTKIKNWDYNLNWK